MKHPHYSYGSLKHYEKSREAEFVWCCGTDDWCPYPAISNYLGSDTDRNKAFYRCRKPCEMIVGPGKETILASFSERKILSFPVLIFSYSSFKWPKESLFVTGRTSLKVRKNSLVQLDAKVWKVLSNHEAKLGDSIWACTVIEYQNSKTSLFCLFLTPTP